MTTPNLGLTEVPSNSMQPSVPINDALQVIDALTRPGGIVQDKDLTTPPTTVVGDVGKRWIIPAGATGVWSGKTGQIAHCTAATLWRYYTPTEGWRAYLLDENADYIHNGSAWALAAAAVVADGDKGDITVSASGVVWTIDADVVAAIRSVPQNSQSAAYTAVLTDAGKHILHPSADTTARIFTIPANSSVAYPIGTALTFVNQNAAGVITISITTDTMRLAGAGTTGSRALAANGVATALKITSTEWIISGTGLT